MKIAVISSGHIPSQWAHSINTVKHAFSFAQLGYDVELLTVERFSETRNRMRTKEFCEWYGVGEIRVKYFKDHSMAYYKEHPLLRLPIRMVNALLKIDVERWSNVESRMSQYAKEQRFDLCYCRSYRAVRSNIQLGIPTILESHNPHPGENSELLAVIAMSRSPFFVKLVTIHQKLKENFANLGVPEEKIAVLESAVDLERFDAVTAPKETLRATTGLPPDKTIVMYCGSLKPGKGIRRLIETAADFKDIRHVEFYIVGGNENEVKMWASLAEKHKVHNITFTGFVPGKQVPLFLKSADVLALPYDIQEESRVMDLETTSPIKLFEYMASGVPIVATNIQPIAKVIQHGQEGLLVDHDHGGLGQAIRSLLDDPDEGRRLASNAYTRAMKFTYRNRCREILTSQAAPTQEIACTGARV